jgi:tetratricopeptide (TPR) repeat protein
MRSRLNPLPSLVTATLLIAVTSALPIAANSQSATQERTILHDGNEATIDRKVAVAQLLQKGIQQYRSRTQERTILHDGNEATIDRKVAVAQLLQKGIQQYRSRQYQEALTTYQQVLSIRRELRDEAGVASALHNIGTIYFRLRQTNQAKEFLQQALAIRKQIGDKAGAARTLNNISKFRPRRSSSGEVSLIFEDDEKQATPPSSQRSSYFPHR